MLGAVFFTTVVIVLTGHYVLVERPRRIAREASQGPRALPVRELIPRLPSGVFLQPTFTWSHVRSNGDVELGVHPLLYGLVGPGATVEFAHTEEEVEKGDVLLKIRLGDRSLSVRSPIGGRLVASNKRVSTEPAWRGIGPRDGNWVCVVRPERLAEEVPGWMIADNARDWTRKQYGTIRDFMMTSSGTEHAPVALADGGELPLGALDEIDSGAWAEFENVFLSART
jgi:glycine cleavage system H lipoate-binding protein